MYPSKRPARRQQVSLWTEEQTPETENYAECRKNPKVKNPKHGLTLCKYGSFRRLVELASSHRVFQKGKVIGYIAE